jgi:peptidylprolyl isomerase
MAQAKKGDTVKIHYTGSLEDGTVFDSSANRDPLQFTIGDGKVIPGFELAVAGMSPGESKTEKIPADQAYGPRMKEMVVEVNRAEIPPELKPEVGQQLQMSRDDGRVIPFTITDMSESKVTLDANHPLAGKDLIFKIELIEVT